VREQATRMREDSDPGREVLLHNGTSPCPYLPGQIARLPWRLPVRPLDRVEFGRRLAAGDRRQGVLLYRPTCATCTACQAIRLEVAAFEPTRSQNRTWRRGQNELQTVIERPAVSRDKVRLYNRHKIERGLLVGQELVDMVGYEQFLVETCTETFELTYHYRGTLVGVAVTDRAADGLSAVYCFYDPDYAWLGLGTYSILSQVALCAQWGLRHLYLGLYVPGCAAMAYKTRFLPHERLIDGQWQRFERASSSDGQAPA
jgi:arginyl-tRNA--protein-N-Asp/Glu arginylyltransferase